MQMFSDVGDDRLANERSSAPPGGADLSLFQHCHAIVSHLAQHKGPPVNPMHPWTGGEGWPMEGTPVTFGQRRQAAKGP